MSRIYPKDGMLYARLRGVKVPGKWGGKSTGYKVGQEALAREYAKNAQRIIDRKARAAAGAPVAIDTSPITLRRWIARWLELRQESGHDWKQDKGRLETHVLPVLGDVELAAIRPHHIAKLVRGLRFDAKKKRAPRTVHNIYTVLCAVFRDAMVEEDPLIDVSPCVLTEAQLGPIKDADPEWRAGALFTRDEAEILISDGRIPLDRRLGYAFGLLSGMRPGELAALRVRHYDPTAQPLGRLLVAIAWNAKRAVLKGTKTEAPKSIPVHPTLAELLDEWLREGWAKMMGRAPGPDDLLLPLPPANAARRTKRTGDAFRGYNYSSRRWRETDRPMLGWRPRALYDTKATFISIALEDGADRDILRDRVTHTKRQTDAFDGYDRGVYWVQTCTEVAKLKIRRRLELATAFATVDENRRDLVELLGSGGGLRSPASGREDTREVDVVVGVRPRTVADDDSSRDGAVAWLATALASAVLGGDWKVARRLAREVKALRRGVAPRAG